MNGIVVVDKPLGPTSFDVVARLRRVFSTREIGHCGTLDPLATGVLVVAVGSYTRLVRVLTADDKRYTATIGFGASTTTDDAEGDVVARAEDEELARLDEPAVRAALARFVGTLAQRPPAYSAVHVGGERAYKKARRGEAVEVAAREVVIHALTLTSLEPPGGGRGAAPPLEGARVRRAVVDVCCGKGTYVRALARDLGDALGVPAHLAALRRTASGAFTLADAVALDDVAPSSLLTGPGAVRGVPLVVVGEDDARALRQGKRVRTEVAFAGTGLAHRGEELVALVHVDAGALVVERGFPGAPA